MITESCRMLYLQNSVLAALDGLTEILWSLGLQALVKDVLKCEHSIVHLLQGHKNAD